MAYHPMLVSMQEKDEGNMKKLADGMYREMNEGAFAALAEAKRLEAEGKRILHFEIGEPGFDTPSHIVEEACKALADGFTRYVPAAGIPELRQAIADDVEVSRGYRPSIDQILVLPGANLGIFFAMAATLNPSDEVIYPDPGFPTYDSTASYLGVKKVPVPLFEDNAFRMAPEDVGSRITDNTKLIILNSPQNPTGSAIKKNELEEIAEMARERDIFLLSDEVYSKMLYHGEHHSPTVLDGARDRSILLDGFSKNYSMTGWRLGYMVGPEELIKRLTKLFITTISCTTAFVQKAGVAAIKGDQTFLHGMMDTFLERRDTMVKGLNSIPGFKCLTPDGAFYAFANIRETGMTSAEMTHHLLYKAGVAVLPGTVFGPGGEGYVRFAFATSLENIREAIDNIKTSLE